MNKKLQVFVSSTYTDLIEERQAAVKAILDAGHIPAGMELFKAGKSQMETIHKWIDESDVYMLILGGRYGSIEEESGLSYTELEYRYALSKNMPVFAIVLDESFLFTKAASYGKDAIFEKYNKDKYNDFLSLIKSNIVKFVENKDKISYSIHSHLNSILLDNNYNLIGWVRNDISSDNKSIDFNSLTKILKNTIAYKDSNSGKNLTYYDHFKQHFNHYCNGVSNSYMENTYIYYSGIYLFCGLAKKITKNGIEVIQLTELGFNYYKYIISIDS